MKDRFIAFGFPVSKCAQHKSLFHKLCRKSIIQTWNRKWSFALIVADKRTSPVAQRVMDITNDTEALERLADLLACPNCRNSLVSRNNRSFICLNCYRTFFQDPYAGYFNLCLDKLSSYRPIQQELFRNPVTSFLYERGWRNNFQTMGYPLKEEVRLCYKKTCQNEKIFAYCWNRLIRKYVEGSLSPHVT
ncbi:Uncharacterized methyltransferase chloroplastic [Galdieria sulphuraria]|nr:Uncharacterized methyltransferase chloroplastic [Galdieria sulphuraria]